MFKDPTKIYLTLDKQPIGITRAINKNTDLIILHECTCALDKNQEIRYLLLKIN